MPIEEFTTAKVKDYGEGSEKDTPLGMMEQAG